MWGEGFGECSTCRTNGSPTWTCPAAVSTYADIGGSGADIVQTDSVGGEKTRLDTKHAANIIQSGPPAER